MRKNASRTALVLLIATLAGCATQRVLPPFDSVDRYVYGAWVDVRRLTPKAPAVRGELLAVSPDRLYVATAAGTVEVPKNDVARATVTLYNPESIATKITAGMLFSITNGALALLTIPGWAITGATVLHDVNVSAEIDYPRSPWESLSEGARFPQGAPEGMDLATLRGPTPEAVRAGSSH